MPQETPGDLNPSFDGKTDEELQAELARLEADLPSGTPLDETKEQTHVRNATREQKGQLREWGYWQLDGLSFEEAERIIKNYKAKWKAGKKEPVEPPAVSPGEIRMGEEQEGVGPIPSDTHAPKTDP